MTKPIYNDFILKSYKRKNVHSGRGTDRKNFNRRIERKIGNKKIYSDKENLFELNQIYSDLIEKYIQLIYLFYVEFNPICPMLIEFNRFYSSLNEFFRFFQYLN